MRAVLVLAAVVAGLCAVAGSCTNSYDCCGACPGSVPAVFLLTCATTDLTSVTATGPCATPDAALSSYLGSYMGGGQVYIYSQGPGACHVDLTFATGFTFAADVTFATQSGGVCGGPQCKCSDYLQPTAGPFMVENPSATCVDAGTGIDAQGNPGDARASDGETGAEAQCVDANSDCDQ